jgi:gamma-glutamylaminecyclotransferase
MTNLFFVYGTLKKNYGNHTLLKGCKYLGKALTLNNYTVYHMGFPQAMLYSDGLPLLGELYDVPSPEVVESLDRLESNGYFYTRAVRDVKIIDFFEEKVKAWIYEVPDGRYGGGTHCPVNEEYQAYEWKR